MLGTQENARRAVLRELPLLGEGTGRQVYHIPGDDVVYKVEWYNGNAANNAEYSKWSRLQGFDTPERLGIPDMYQRDIDGIVVNVMTYIEGEPYCFGYDDDDVELCNWLYANRLSDIHSRNVIKDNDGTIWIIDLEI